MCGRYALTRTELLEEFFEFSFTGHQIIPRFNIAPTTQIPVIPGQTFSSDTNYTFLRG